MENRKIIVSKIMLIVILCLMLLFALVNIVFDSQSKFGGESDHPSSGYHIQIVTEKDRDYFWNDWRGQNRRPRIRGYP